MKLSPITGIILALVCYGIIGYINEFVAQNQIDHEIDRPPLYDRLHNILPHISHWYPDIGLILFVMYFIIRWGVEYPRVFENYIWIIVFLFIGRVVIFSLTQMPPPRDGCSTKEKGDKIRVNVFRKNWVECLDLMYSGHTFHTILVSLFVLYIAPNIYEKILVFACSCVEMLLVIAGRLHYTSDVLVSALITVLFFFSWPGIDKIFSYIKLPMIIQHSSQ